MSDPENNDPEYGWFANRSGTDSREAPQGIEAFFVLNDGAGNMIALRSENVRLVRLEGEAAPEIIEPQEGGLYPPESFRHDNGAINRGYGLQVNPENPPPQGLPAGSIDADGIINTALWGTYIAWMRPDPNDPSQNIRFDPVEEGFQIRRFEGQSLSPQAGLQGDDASAPVSEIEPAAGSEREMPDPLAYAASIYASEESADYALNMVSQILADYALNSDGENFRHMPQLDESGMIVTVRTGEGISAVWHNPQGHEMLLNAEEMRGVLSSPDINESTANVLALALYAVDQVENGYTEPSQDRTAANKPATEQERAGAEQSTPALETLGR